MEKIIKCKMNDDKSISVLLNEVEKFKIGADNRSVKASDIYNLFEYAVGDTYTIISENSNRLDKPVLNFFTEVLNKIAEQINKIECNVDM